MRSPRITRVATSAPTTIRGSLDTHGRYRPFEWTFGARVDDQLVEGEIVTEPVDVVGLTHTDTDGMTKDCYSSAIATCRIHWQARLTG